MVHEPDGFSHYEKDKLITGLPNSVVFHNFSICPLASNFLAGCMIGGCGRGDI